MKFENNVPVQYDCVDALLTLRFYDVFVIRVQPFCLDLICKYERQIASIKVFMLQKLLMTSFKLKM